MKLGNPFTECEVAFFYHGKAHMLTISHLMQQGRSLDHDK